MTLNDSFVLFKLYLPKKSFKTKYKNISSNNILTITKWETHFKRVSHFD